MYGIFVGIAEKGVWTLFIVRPVHSVDLVETEVESVLVGLLVTYLVSFCQNELHICSP